MTVYEPSLEGLDHMSFIEVVSDQDASREPSNAFTPTADDIGLPELDEESAWSESAIFESARSRNFTVDVPAAVLVTPRSRYEEFQPPHRSMRERAAIDMLMLSNEPGSPQDFVEFELSDFSIYVNSAKYPLEMRSLQKLGTSAGNDVLYFDGVLRNGGQKCYVEKVQIIELPIGNYGSDIPSVGDQIWVRSRLNRRDEIYYRLAKPTAEYARFHEPFLWVADLTKHVVDFASAMVDANRDVSLASFEHEFIHWLQKTHKKSEAMQTWLLKHPSEDFRTSIVANIDFIWKELVGVLELGRVSRLALFRETRSELFRDRPSYMPPRGLVGTGKDAQYPTVVTPYIMECFGHMGVGKMLRLAAQDDLQSAAQPQSQPRVPWNVSAGFLSMEAVGRIEVGDTISTPHDGDATDTKWRRVESKTSTDDGRWFGLVQRVHISKQGHRSFDVTWLYRPAETPCCVMKYPWPNELFLSDHCTCEEGAKARIKEGEVLAVHPINWFGSPNGSDDGLFIRQLYMVEERRWVTLKKSHLRCQHGHQTVDFEAGDSILASLPSDLSAEPYEVVKLFKQGEKLFVRLRRLLRRKATDIRSQNIPENELLYTDQLVDVNLARLEIWGKCYIRFFRPQMPIPSPYDRGGTGNLFYITHRLDGGNACIPLDDYPPSLRQGFDPSIECEKLRGLDLFCGAGNFGRGLEDGGVVEMRWANDIWNKAIHTYMANTTGKTAPYLGSIDDFLQDAVTGRFSECVPRPGEVDFISAGSPCPGFSLLTQDKSTCKQMKNQSLVASFASFVDLYRPKYGVLENVSGIVPAKRYQSENMMSQLFCAIVGMGYQAQLILGDAWSHGSPQTRSRVFLYFAAPGLRLPRAPLPSHSHHPQVRNRGIGELCNGEPFVRRSFEPTAFKFTTPAGSTRDLPAIYDAKPDSCIAFPDHRIASSHTYERLREYAAIPMHPYGMNFSRAWNGGKGVMSSSDRELFPEEGKGRTKAVAQGYCRQHPERPFNTVTTGSNPTNARAGAGLHWSEDRALTVMEVRRAQGFLDHEVLLGNPSDQWKLVGNSVARQMALALGLKFREAWLGSLYDDAGPASRPVLHPLMESMDLGSNLEAPYDSGSTAQSPSPSEDGDRAEHALAAAVSAATPSATTPTPRAKRGLPVESDDDIDMGSHHSSKMTRRLLEGELKTLTDDPPAVASASSSPPRSGLTVRQRSEDSQLKQGPSVVWIECD